MTRIATTRPAAASPLAALRALVPARSLTRPEECFLAERQAGALLRWTGITEPAVPQFVISALPQITVERKTDWPTSGMTAQTPHGWHVVLCADESLSRQRFSLAHEFKHILDHPVIERLHRHLPAETRHARAEQIANVFAACLLMPRTWLKRDWALGHQTLDVLTHRYGVSSEAMAIRLADLGLYQPIRSKQ